MSEAALGAMGAALNSLSEAIAGALGKALEWAATFWVDVPTPNLTNGSLTSPSAEVGFIRDSLWYYMSGLAVLSTIVGGARMALERRSQPGKDLARALFVYMTVCALSVALIGIGVRLSDQFSRWVIDRAGGGETFGQNLIGLFGLDPTGQTRTLGAVVMIMLCLIGLMSSFVQLVLMLVRGGMLVVMAGILPLSASFLTTQAGRQWFQKAMAWTLAFMLYKPAAALVYATAFKLGSANAWGSEGVVKILTGIAMMVLAIFALPALMRFLTPLVGPVAGAAAGGVMGATLGMVAVSALPTGAAMMRRGGSGPGGSAGGTGPSGAPGSPGGRSAPSGGAPPSGSPGSGGGGSGAARGAAGASVGGGAAAGAAGASAAAGPVGLVMAGAQVAGQVSAAGAAAARSTAGRATGEA